MNRLIPVALVVCLLVGLLIVALVARLQPAPTPPADAPAAWIETGDETIVPAASGVRTEDGLYGPVRRLEIEISPFADRFGEWVETARVRESLTEYSASGRQLSVDRFRPDGRLDYRLQYEYDEHDRTLTETSFDARGATLYKWIHTYDETGARRSLSGYNSDGTLDFRLMITYDDEGRVLREVSYDAQEVINYETDYVYEGDRTIRTTRYRTPGGVADTTSVETFDGMGNRIEERAYGMNDELQYRVAYRYDAEGLLLEETAFDSGDRVEYRLVNTYDDRGLLLEATEYNGDGGLFYRYLNAYDERGNLVERRSITADGATAFRFHYTYEFDAHGNWTKRVTSRYVTRFGEETVEPVEATHRLIEYFDRTPAPTRQRIVTPDE